MRTFKYTAEVSLTCSTCSIYVNIHKHLICICVGVQIALGKIDVLPKLQPGTQSIRNKLIYISFIVSMGFRYPYWHLPWYYSLTWNQFSVTHLKYHERFPRAIYTFQFSCKFWSVLKASSQSWKSHSLVEVYRRFVEIRCLHKQNTWDEACRVNMEAACSSEKSVRFYKATWCI
jgi:hypothetical protein